jgi:hypothetical protein
MLGNMRTARPRFLRARANASPITSKKARTETRVVMVQSREHRHLIHFSVRLPCGLDRPVFFLCVHALCSLEEQEAF